MLTGKLYSPRALAKLSGTDFVKGNNVASVLYMADNGGLIPYDLWPVPETFTWDEFYQEIPQSVQDKAERLDIVLIPPDLTKSPIWTEFEGLNSNTNQLYLHMVAGTGGQYVDSEPGGQIKSFGNKTIEWQSSIKINNPPNSMQIVNNNGTYSLEGEKGYIGINHIEFLNELLKITGHVENRTPQGTQQGIVETASVFQIKDA